MTATAARFVALAPERRALAFGQAAARLAAASVIVEKDFWVCWLLGLLFADPELAPHLVFKGGTSLSKVYGVIERFSEDIDLSLSPEFLGVDESSIEAAQSRTRRDAAMNRMQDACAERTRAFVMPRLETRAQALLGGPPHNEAWLRYERDPVARSPVIHFEYPTVEATGLHYVRREVKLELGSLTDQRPIEQHDIRPWVADILPTIFDDWKCRVTALELPRSFWEKATILHAEYHRPEDQPTPDRYSRHYADMARLLQHPSAASMLGDHGLCARVVQWKDHVFARHWAHYHTAVPGSFRLLPKATRTAALARDYNQMASMYLKPPPTFDAVLGQLAEAEAILNGAVV
ncbi:MAG TPA: nucleotidyl transferase AbiEii/AbiGii toxin family protein [Thermoanaerobaculia bacterium]|nr:nucleotidyl transferase AbiEii/AbiGii toxin family protein [Thermoanaerobaculia bacterium]